MAEEPNCIICMHDDGYEIIGPCADWRTLLAMGKRWASEHGDDPRWQTIHLADPHAPPRVITPTNDESAPGRAGGVDADQGWHNACFRDRRL